MRESLCPEAEMRARMTDDEFWDHVYRQYVGDRDYDPADDPNVPDPGDVELERRLADPCPECGQIGACAYDVEGRALIHATTPEDPDDRL